MTFCIYEIANNPIVQAKVYSEINDVLQKYDGKLNYEALNQMTYLESCVDGMDEHLYSVRKWMNWFPLTFFFSETLRKHPPFSIISRECTKDYKIADTEIVIEKGTPIFISITAPQDDPIYYKEPTKFIPERFTSDQSINKNSAEKPYLAFGDGPRNCIGMRLGKLQAKVGICILLQKFSFELGDEIVKNGLKICPKSAAKAPIGGMNLKITAR